MEVSEPFITIEGAAERINSLTMNGKEITVTEDGVFTERYVLTPGYNRITLAAKDRYGKTTERSIEIVYTPTSTPRIGETAPQSSSTPPVAP